ncbi:MAG: hypothetical protein WAM66_07760 [Acidobacteriaceae bacterium]
MRKFAVATVVLVCCQAICLDAQRSAVPKCASRLEFAPTVVSNPDSTVTFKCGRATPMDLIRAVGRQTRIPIGIVLGQHPDILSRSGRPYDLEKVDARSALQMAIRDTGYTLDEESGVMVLIAGDLTARQQDLLTYPYSDFGPVSNQTMVELGAMLTGWMLADVDYANGYVGSILGSTNDERFSLRPISNATTEQIANRIVSLGSKGMWILKANAFPTRSPSDSVVIEPYQHYSNLPNIEH